MTSRDRKFNRTLRAIARHNARLGKRPARELDPREDRSNHAALTRWGKKQLAKRRAKIAESVRRALRPAKKRDGGKDDFGARLIERVGSVPRDVDLGFDSENSDAAIEKSRLVMDMLELLRAIRGNMTTKADFAAMRKDIRSFRKAMPAFGLDAHNLDLIRNAREERDAPYALADKDLITSRRIFRLALQTFGSNANVRRWLVEPGSWAIDYQIPAVLLQSPQRRKMLEDFLGRLAYGVYQ